MPKNSLGAGRATFINGVLFLGKSSELKDNPYLSKEQRRERGRARIESLRRSKIAEWEEEERSQRAAKEKAWVDSRPSSAVRALNWGVWKLSRLLAVRLEVDEAAAEDWFSWFGDILHPED